jgi:branched-chain amino acid aminotransferase
VAITPDRQSDILESITRDTVLTLLKEAGIATQERKVDRSELTMADEAFFCGTAWEIAPVRSIDGLALSAGSPGPITQMLRQRFDALTKGTDPTHPEWRTPLK